MAKTKYETHILPHLDRITAWAAKGATANEIAGKLRVAYSTFRKYRDLGEGGDKRYIALADSFAQARRVPDDRVEAALYKRACGMEYTEVKVSESINRRTGELEELTTKTTRFIPPDPTSAMFWLTNRRGERWRYKPGPADADGDESGGVVELAPVMESPSPPGADGGGESG